MAFQILLRDGPSRALWPRIFVSSQMKTSDLDPRLRATGCMFVLDERDGLCLLNASNEIVVTWPFPSPLQLEPIVVTIDSRALRTLVASASSSSSSLPVSSSPVKIKRPRKTKQAVSEENKREETHDSTKKAELQQERDEEDAKKADNEGEEEKEDDKEEDDQVGSEKTKRPSSLERSSDERPAKKQRTDSATAPVSVTPPTPAPVLSAAALLATMKAKKGIPSSEGKTKTLDIVQDNDSDDDEAAKALAEKNALRRERDRIRREKKKREAELAAAAAVTTDTKADDPIDDS